jgi:nicotinate dehydrogenase subunit B
VLKEKVRFTQTAVESVEWGGYPILTFEEVPDIDVLMIPRPDEPPLGVGESASVPSAAAIVNAIYDATGVRFRELPLTPDRVLAGLNGQERQVKRERRKESGKRLFRFGLGFAGIAGIALGGLAAFSPWRPSIAAIQRPDPALFSAASIERGRLVAAVGGCNTCHTDVNSAALGGGRAFETPFGTVYAANISPDASHGIGSWSYAAFERAMREGISRDGSHLYPVHPYTAFRHASDGDLQDLYAYLMASPAAALPAPETQLKAPFNIRPLMAGWNGLYLDAAKVPFDPVKGEVWNRGAYLVESLGHCSACHSDRNALGAEGRGAAHLAGGFADGYEAPALNAARAGPVAWTQSAFFDYLRHGHAADHGSAVGPMAEVVRSLSALPDADIAAMATYLADLSPSVSSEAAASQRQTAVLASDAAADAARLAYPEGARIFEGACASCHAGGTPLVNLALNSNLHSAKPTNVLNAIFRGADAPASLAARHTADAEVMSMPAFADSFSDRQVAELTAYLRARFAPQKADWADLERAARSVREAKIAQY